MKLVICMLIGGTLSYCLTLYDATLGFTLCIPIGLFFGWLAAKWDGLT